MSERPSQSLPRLLVLCTGGTIAGTAESRLALEDYNAGVLDGEQLLAALPDAGCVADLEVEQLANIDSADMSHRLWLQLLRRIDAAFRQDPGLSGVVITHGTNTLEETAYWLHLALGHARPVVLVGAMRPSTALSADGPLNLLQALQVAVHPQAVGRGVLVVMDGEIHGAREVTKVACSGVAAFRSPGHGRLGTVDGDGVRFTRTPSHRHTTDSGLVVDRSSFAAMPDPECWPLVEILYGYVQPSTRLIEALIDAGVDALVFAGTGAGQLSCFERLALERKCLPQGRCQEVPLLVRTSRTGRGRVLARSDDELLGLLPAEDLSPQKARVLVLLALLQGADRQRLADLLLTH